jgi:hypothetical protein
MEMHMGYRLSGIPADIRHDSVSGTRKIMPMRHFLAE